MFDPKGDVRARSHVKSVGACRGRCHSGGRKASRVTMEISSFLLLGVLTTLVFGGAMLAMAIGPMFKRKCLRGSCGGSAVRDANGEVISCHDCPKRAKRYPCGDERTVAPERSMSIRCRELLFIVN